MSNWKTYKLSDFAEINPRISLKQGHEYSFVEMKNLDATFKYVTPSAKKELKGGAKFENGDTLFARITPCLENGKICQVKDLENNIGFGSTEFLIFRGKENISDTDFVYYLMRSDYVRNNAIQMMSGTSGRQRVEKSALEELEIQAPDLATQVEIAQILSSFDDKIELLQQMNQTLENIAQAIFKEWFVDFNFPGFDGELVDGLPIGWKMLPLKDVATIINGFAFKSSDYKENGIFMLRSQNINDTGSIDKKNIIYLDKEKIQKHKQQYLLAYDYLMVMVGASIGKQGIVRPFNLPAILNQNIWNFRPNSLPRHYFNYFLKINLENYIGYASGSAREFVKKSDYYNLPILIPSTKLLDKIEEYLLSVEEKISNNLSQIQTLTQTRDTLLPKLMNGELEIKN